MGTSPHQGHLRADKGIRGTQALAMASLSCTLSCPHSWSHRG